MVLFEEFLLRRGVCFSRDQLTALPSHERWTSGARAAFRDDLFEHHRSLCISVLTDGMSAASATARHETCKRQHHAAVDIWLGLVADLKSQDELHTAMLSVALRALHQLASSTAPGHGGRSVPEG